MGCVQNKQCSDNSTDESEKLETKNSTCDSNKRSSAVVLAANHVNESHFGEKPPKADDVDETEDVTNGREKDDLKLKSFSSSEFEVAADLDLDTKTKDKMIGHHHHSAPHIPSKFTSNPSATDNVTRCPALKQFDTANVEEARCNSSPIGVVHGRGRGRGRGRQPGRGRGGPKVDYHVINQGCKALNNDELQMEGLVDEIDDSGGNSSSSESDHDVENVYDWCDSTQKTSSSNENKGGENSDRGKVSKLEDGGEDDKVYDWCEMNTEDSEVIKDAYIPQNDCKKITPSACPSPSQRNGNASISVSTKSNVAEFNHITARSKVQPVLKKDPSSTLVNPSSNQPAVIRDTKVVKKKKAPVPRGNLPHPTPKFGDWLNSRKMINNYIILESLGAGSYAEVKLCKEKVSGCLYAMKFISRDLMKHNSLSNKSKIDDIKQEIAIMKKLNHPNVLRLYEVMDDPNVNKLYLVLEYMKQGDLLTRQKAKSSNGSCMPMDDHEVHCVLLQVLLGLVYLHDQKIVHGDIKPQNLLVGDHGMVKIADFGISQSLYGSKQTLTDTAGTPAFMSPEMCSGEQCRAEILFAESFNHYSGQLADVWAVGATIFMLKFGRPPFVAKSAIQIFERIQHDPLEFPKNETIDQDLENLLRGMLVKNPSKRMTLLDVMKHRWVTKDEKSPIITDNFEHSTPIQVSKEEISGAIHGSGKFVLLINVRIIMMKKLQQARKRLLEKKNLLAAENNSKMSRRESRTILICDGNSDVLSVEESTLRSKIFAKKKASHKALKHEIISDTVCENDDSSSSNEEDDCDVVQQSPQLLDELLLTTLCMPAAATTEVLSEVQDSQSDEVSINVFSNEELALKFGMVSMQGRRSTQEDRSLLIADISGYLVEINCKTTFFQPKSNGKSVAAFFAGVYDGHGGTLCASILLNNLHLHLFNALDHNHAVHDAIENSCEEMDAYICEELQQKNDTSGSTATFVFGLNSKLYVGHVGDCRAIMSHGKDNEFTVVTSDQRPTRTDERDRIIKNGGYIVNERVSGILAISRSFGDLEFKGLLTNEMKLENRSEPMAQLINAKPEIIEIDIQDSDEFFIIACDGLWDVMQNEEAIRFVRGRLKCHKNVQLATKELIQESIRRFSNDNVTVIIIQFNQ